MQNTIKDSISFVLCLQLRKYFGTEKHQLLEREKSKQNIDKRVQKHVKLSSYNINMFCRNHFLHQRTSNKLELLNAISQVSISLSYYYPFLLASNVRPVYPFSFTPFACTFVSAIDWKNNNCVKSKPYQILLTHIRIMYNLIETRIMQTH